MYFDIFKSASGYTQKYWWVAKGENHETLCAPKMLSSKQACINTIRVIKDGADAANVYDKTGEAQGDVSARRIQV